MGLGVMWDKSMGSGGCGHANVDLKKTVHISQI